MAKKYNISKNFFTVQGWMITELGLKGNELMAYAIVYGFSQDGNSHYTGSINYLAQWLNCTRNTVIETMKSLCDKKLLKKEQVEINSIIFNKYYALNIGSSISEPPVQKYNEKGSAENALLVQKNDEGSAIFAPNNIININSNNRGEDEILKNELKLPELEDLVEICKKIIKNKLWVETIQYSLKITKIEELKDWLNNFNLSLCGTDKIKNIDERKYKTLFLGWMRSKSSLGITLESYNTQLTAQKSKKNNYGYTSTPLRGYNGELMP